MILSYCTWYAEARETPEFDPEESFMADIRAYYGRYSQRGPLPKGMSEYQSGIPRREVLPLASPRKPVSKRPVGRKGAGRGQPAPPDDPPKKRSRESPDGEQEESESEVPLVRRPRSQRGREKLLIDLLRPEDPQSAAEEPLSTAAVVGAEHGPPLPEAI